MTARARSFAREAYRRRSEGFGGTIFKALQGDNTALIDALHGEGSIVLSEEERRRLADFIAAKTPRPPYRPKGSLKPQTAAVMFAAYLVRVAVRAYCEAHGKQRLGSKQRSLRETFRTRAIELARKECPSVTVDPDAVEALEWRRIDLGFVGAVEDSTLHEAGREMERLGANPPT